MIGMRNPNLGLTLGSDFRVQPRILEGSRHPRLQEVDPLWVAEEPEDTARNARPPGDLGLLLGMFRAAVGSVNDRL